MSGGAQDQQKKKQRTAHMANRNQKLSKTSEFNLGNEGTDLL